MGDSKEIIENQEVELKQEETVAGVPAQEEEEVETPEAREAFITDWNERNKEFGEIRMEKPTPEEVKAVMDEYTEKVKEYNERQFELADENNALRVARFLRVWNRDDVQWENNLWQGTIMFDQILTEFINSFDAKNKKPLKVGYQPLVYLYLTMRNMKGQGLESALHMQKSTMSLFLFWIPLVISLKNIRMTVRNSNCFNRSGICSNSDIMLL